MSECHIKPLDADMNNWFIARYNLAAMLGLFLIVFVLYGSALSGWWRWDDPDHLLFVMQYSPWQYFFAPAVWQEISIAHFTPWLSLSYDTDLWLFGLKPAAHYVHHLIFLWLAAVLTFLLLKLWLKPLWSLLGAVLFIIGAPVAVVAQQLMSRHYVEGLCFGIAALYLFVLSLRKDDARLSWIGAVFYLLAAASKEIYVPLVCLLPFINEGDLRQRLRQTVPFLLVLAVYIPWRWYMLGVPLGGYADASTYSLTTLFTSIVNIPAYLLGIDLLGRIALLIVFFLVAMAVALGHLNPITLLLSIALLLGPLVPVMAIEWKLIETERFFFLPWWAFSCTVALALDRISVFGRRAALFSFAVYFLIAGVGFHQAWQAGIELQERVHEIDTHGQFVWNANSSQVIFLPNVGVPVELMEVKKKAIKNSEVPVIVVDEIQLADMDKSILTVWAYNPGCGCFEEISNKISSLLDEWNGRRTIKPLSVRASYEENIISWRFGPYPTGTYSIIDKDIGKTLVPREGRRRIRARFEATYIRYDSPEGWITYSDPLSLRPDTGRPLIWER